MSADGSGSTIKGLAIGNFAGDGIELAGNDRGSVVESSWIGIFPAGSPMPATTVPASGSRTALRTGSAARRRPQRVVLGANGGPTQAPHIVITGSLASDNVVEGSYIGLDADGSSTFDTKDGVLITSGASKNTIGGDSTAGEGNIVYGLYGRGVVLDGAGTANIVAGNTIGTDAVRADRCGAGRRSRGDRNRRDGDRRQRRSRRHLHARASPTTATS